MKREERMKRVGELVSALLDETIGEEQKRELNGLLSGAPDACEYYLDLAEAHAALLHDHVGDELLPAFAEDKTISFPTRRKSRGWKVFAAAAMVLLLLNGALVLFQRAKEGAEPMADREWVAVLSRVVDPEWKKGAASPEEGSGLRPGLFSLESGLAQIEFFSGASVIVEGPAELKIESPWLVECLSGRLRASVPEPAQGFTIVTPDYRAVDLGTEFALSVGPDGGSELHVVDGEVRLDDDSGNELQRLEGGGSIRSKAGAIESMPGGGRNFIDPERLRGLAEADWQTQYRAWESARDALREDPALLVLFDFEDQKSWDRELTNRKEEGPHAAIIGARWTEGRWPGKGAIEFKRITDRVRLHVPGEFDELTFSCWVRVEGLDRWLSSLMLTDDFDQGEVHWQISDRGEMILGISKEGKGGPNTISPPVIGPDHLGKWIHLATTANRVTGDVVHYFDGKVVKRDQRDRLPPFSIGDAEIGNWSSQAGTHPIRSFNGRMDEFALLKRAMTEGEVRRIFEAGR